MGGPFMAFMGSPNYGGSDGLRDLGLLESALAQPQAGFGEQYLHADVYELVLKTATGSLSKTEIAVFLRSHSQ